MTNKLYRKLEYALYGTVLLVSAGVAIVAERLDFRLQKQELAAEIASFNQDFAHRLEAEIAQLVASAMGLSAAVALNGDIDDKKFAEAALRLGTDKTIVRSISLATDGIVRQLYPCNQNVLRSLYLQKRTGGVSIRHGGIRNRAVFLISFPDQRIGSRAFVLSIVCPLRPGLVFIACCRSIADMSGGWSGERLGELGVS